nr:squalene/phytoene synthase family protein [Lentibacter algarum]
MPACAEIVFKADPDRFRALMATPLSIREKLLPLYAFNAEVARAPWVTGEAMIAEMRLQWWHDALGEIIEGKPVRRHEVTTPLAALLTRADAQQLQTMIEARRWDIYFDGFSSDAALWQHLNDTSTPLLATALRQAGEVALADSEPLALGAQAFGLAGWFLAVPTLKAAGRAPLPDESVTALKALAKSGLNKLQALRSAKPSNQAKQVLLSGWKAAPVLALAAKHPEGILNGSLGQSAAMSRLRLARMAMLKQL